MKNFYELIDYVPGTNDPGVATIRVIGCNAQTQLNVPVGTVVDDPMWQYTIAVVVASVLPYTVPQCPEYYSALDNWPYEV